MCAGEGVWSACQLANFSVCRLFDLLARWEVGKLDRREAGRGRKIAALQKKRGWAHPPLSFPMKGRRGKEVCPPIVTEQGAEKSEE